MRIGIGSMYNFRIINPNRVQLNSKEIRAEAWSCSEIYGSRKKKAVESAETH